jgi:MFS family permease
MEVAGILWLVNEMTRSPLILTIVSACRFVPMIFFPIAGGVVADRVNRRNLLAATLLGFALLNAILAFLAFTGLITVYHLIVVSLLSGIIMSFNHPTRQAIVPNLVNKEHLLNAISFDTLSVQGSRVVGAAIAGYIIATLGVWPTFAIRALGCLIAVFWLFLANVPPTPQKTKTQMPWRNLTEGFHYLLSNTIILSLISLYLIPWLAQNTFTSFMPILAKNIVQVGDIGYGYFQAAPGFGAVVCLIGLAALSSHKGKAELLIYAGTVLGVGLLGLSVSHWVYLSLPLLVLIGSAVTTIVALNTTLIVGITPDELRGRVMSWREVAFGIGPTGSILFGAIAKSTGVPFSLGLLGVICVVISLCFIMLLPKLRSLG